jgi:hypothetical protein
MKLFGSGRTKPLFQIVASKKYPSPKKLASALEFGLPHAEVARRYDGTSDVAGMFTPDTYYALDLARAHGRNYIYGDHAYLVRHKFYRLTLNKYQIEVVGSSDLKRFNSLGLEVRPWKKSGSKILLAPQSDIYMSKFGISQKEWITSTIEGLSKFTDRQVVISQKKPSSAEENFESQLEDVFAVIVFNSVAGLQAVRMGIPCFTTTQCASTYFGRLGIENIEKPLYIEDRLLKFGILADNQFTLDEIENGLAWKHIQPKMR